MSSLKYYFTASYRRKMIDKLLEGNALFFGEKTLDIGGGRKRGNFIHPKNTEWIYADIVPELMPDVVCNVEQLPFDDESFDSIKATELFEHVENPVQGLKECHRVLRKNGKIIITVPFMHQVHGDPFDYQRWTSDKWKKELDGIGFKIIKIELMGRYFSVLADMLKNLNKALPKVIRLGGYLSYPLLDLLVKLDEMRLVKNNRILKSYTTGYLIVATK